MCPGTHSPVTVRQLRKEDREPIHALLLRADVFTHEEIQVALELIDAGLAHSGIEEYILRTAVDQEGAVAGYYCLGPTPLTSGTYDLYWIAVDPALHGRGIGRVLLAHAEELVASRGGRLIIAETSSLPVYEHTRRFYLARGYTELARIKGYYKVGDDLVIYGKYVSQSGGS
jgi:ribosomal protein S18 acetylase RimI-like enzyme